MEEKQPRRSSLPAEVVRAIANAGAGRRVNRSTHSIDPAQEPILGTLADIRARQSDQRVFTNKDPNKRATRNYYPAKIKITAGDNPKMGSEGRRLCGRIFGCDAVAVLITPVQRPTVKNGVVQCSFRLHANGRTITAWARVITFPSEEAKEMAGYKSVQSHICYVIPTIGE